MGNPTLCNGILDLMVIGAWRKDPNNDLWIRSSHTYGGPVIKWFGTRPGRVELSTRRYSVIDATGTGILLRVISTHYFTPFGTHDYAVHEKYNSGEIVVLMEREYQGTIEEALEWTGIIQEIETA